MTSYIKIQTVQLLTNMIEFVPKEKKKFLHLSQFGAFNVLFSHQMKYFVTIQHSGYQEWYPWSQANLLWSIFFPLCFNRLVELSGVVILHYCSMFPLLNIYHPETYNNLFYI